MAVGSAYILATKKVYINSYLVHIIVLNSTGMDAFSVLHTNPTKCMVLRDQTSYKDTRNSFLFIKTAVNILFLASDIFYGPTSVEMCCGHK